MSLSPVNVYIALVRTAVNDGVETVEVRKMPLILISFCIIKFSDSFSSSSLTEKRWYVAADVAFDVWKIGCKADVNENKEVAALATL